MSNAFENNEQPIPEVQDPITAAKITSLDIEIARIQGINEGLRKLGLHRTADINTGKIQRLLQEKRDLLEG